MNHKIILLIFLFPSAIFAQLSQSVKGIVLDKQSKTPLPGATVILDNQSTQIGSMTDEDGNFELKSVPLGRHELVVSFIGYEPLHSESFLVTSTKVPYLTIELTEGSVSTSEIVITASKNAYEPLNELSTVSSRSFTAEETERIPAGINDPGRVALSYPGVQNGTDDSENQIIVRGNSPIGVLWRLEGIDIPNPNHFAIPGSSGGGITIFSAQLLAKSDFSTGGFAAEYGNAMSAAFDIHFRPGSFDKRESRAKIGLLGLDFATEGPLKKGKSSYLVNYRYSTLGLLSNMGIYLVGERVTNNFQDLSFNLVSRSKNGKTVNTLFGIGGLSEEVYQPVDDPANREPGITNQYENRVKPANMGAMGYTSTTSINSKSYLKSVVAIVASDIKRMEDTLSAENVSFRYNTEQYTDKRISVSVLYNNKVTDKLLIRTGAIMNLIQFEFFKNTFPRNSSSDINTIQTRTSLDGSGKTYTLQQYFQIDYSILPKLHFNAGYHLLNLGLNKQVSLDPRLSLKFSPNSQQNIVLSYGNYHQILPLMNYFYENSLGEKKNENLKFMLSKHLIFSYQFYTEKHYRFQFEAYRQLLSNIPVDPDPSLGYYMLNTQGYFPEKGLLSEGKGYNKGIDFAVEKQFSNNWYFLLGSSFYDAKYKLQNGKEYNTAFNTRFSSHLTLGREFKFKKGSILQIGGRYMYNGGFRFTPADLAASIEKGYYVRQENAFYEGQVPAYKRLDVRISYRFNKKKYAGILNLDIQNVFNRINASSVGYNAVTQQTYVQYRGSGLVPVLSYQVDF